MRMMLICASREFVEWDLHCIHHQLKLEFAVLYCNAMLYIVLHNGECIGLDWIVFNTSLQLDPVPIISWTSRGESCMVVVFKVKLHRTQSFAYF